MNTTAELIATAESRGVSFRLTEGKVRVRAPKSLPQEFTARLKAHKDNIAGFLGLLERLRAGHTWLMEEYARSFATDYSEAERDMFAQGLDTWDGLERELRERHGFSGCVFGTGSRCPDAEEAPLVCDHCAATLSGEAAT